MNAGPDSHRGAVGLRAGEFERRGPVPVVAVAVVCLFLFMENPVMAQVTLRPDHPSNVLNGLSVVSFDGTTLILATSGPGHGLVVLTSDEPLEVEQCVNVRATLRGGWDGTLGYKHYGLEVVIPAAGGVTIRLRSVPAPLKPMPAGEGELATFREAFADRASRFPNDQGGFRAWQKDYRQKLAAWLMNGQLPQRRPGEMKVLDRQDRPNFTLLTFQYESQPGRTTTAILSLPKGVRKAPLLVALHGHEAPWGKADPNAFEMGGADDFCAYFAEHGWAVLQPATMDHLLYQPGWTLQGQWTWDAMVALNHAVAMEEVDASTVAVCGLSTGGHLAMNMLALDDRIKAGVVGCIFSTWNHYRRFRIPPGCDCGIVAQLDPRLEQCDWAALAAPKPVMFQHGRRDWAFCPGAHESLLDLHWNVAVMPQEEYDLAFGEVRRAYELGGQAGHVVTTIHAGVHRVDNVLALEWLNKSLRTAPVVTTGWP